MLSGTRILRAFLIIGCGLSSSTLKERFLGSKFGCPLEGGRPSEGSMSNMLTTSGPLPVGVSSGGQDEEEEEQGDSQESFILDWLPAKKTHKESSSVHAPRYHLYPKCLEDWDDNGTRVAKTWSSAPSWPLDGSTELKADASSKSSLSFQSA